MKQLLIIIFISFLLTSCGHKQPEVETPQKYVLSDTMKRMIAIDTVKYCNAGDEIALTGEVGFNENYVVKVYPRSSGQVIESKVSLGDKVSKGQALAVVKSADMAGSYNDLNSANADLAIAKRQRDNSESLYKNGISSEKEYNEARQNYQKAIAARDKIQALININSGGKANAGGQYIISAPIDGYIVEKNITAGAFIRLDMEDNLFTISDLKNVWVSANVFETDIARVREGDFVKVLPLSYPDKVFIGKIDRVSQVLDPQSKAMKVRIALDNKDMLLKPDMFAKVVIEEMGRDKAICVPTSALISYEGRTYVVLYTNDSNLKAAHIHTYKTVNEQTFIKEGVVPGDRVIVKNQVLIFNQLLNQ